ADGTVVFRLLNGSAQIVDHALQLTAGVVTSLAEPIEERQPIPLGHVKLLGFFEMRPCLPPKLGGAFRGHLLSQAKINAAQQKVRLPSAVRQASDVGQILAQENGESVQSSMRILQHAACPGQITPQMGRPGIVPKRSSPPKSRQDRQAEQEDRNLPQLSRSIRRRG